jgi:hypothetical protein
MSKIVTFFTGNVITAFRHEKTDGQLDLDPVTRHAGAKRKGQGIVLRRLTEVETCLARGIWGDRQMKKGQSLFSPPPHHLHMYIHAVLPSTQRIWVSCGRRRRRDAGSRDESSCWPRVGRGSNRVVLSFVVVFGARSRFPLIASLLFLFMQQLNETKQQLGWRFFLSNC